MTVACVVAAMGLVAIFSTAAGLSGSGSASPASMLSGAASRLGGLGEGGDDQGAQPPAQAPTQAPQPPSGGVGAGSGAPPAAVSGGS